MILFMYLTLLKRWRGHLRMFGFHSSFLPLRYRASTFNLPASNVVCSAYAFVRPLDGNAVVYFHPAVTDCHPSSLAAWYLLFFFILC